VWDGFGVEVQPWRRFGRIIRGKNASDTTTAMYDYSRQTPYTDFGAETALGQRSAVLGKVLGLLGFAFVFTAGGALIGRSLGPGAFLLSIIGSFGTLIALQFLKERSPLNLGLLYAFATFEGMLLGLILDAYVAQGLGGVVLNAAGTTAAVTLAAGAYGYTTKRDLSGMGGILFVGLIGVILASVVGIFIQLPLLYVGISAVAAVLFTGFLVFDLNRVANARGATEGQAILLAVSVYLDILNLFLALLRLFGFAAGGSSNRD
jgi:modulator of FtsH protease